MKKGFSSLGFIIIAFAIIFTFEHNPAITDQAAPEYPVNHESCIVRHQAQALDDCWGLQSEDTTGEIPDERHAGKNEQEHGDEPATRSGVKSRIE